MSKQRMLQGQFASYSYTSGLIDPGQPAALVGAAVVPNTAAGNYMGVARFNDQLYVSNPGAPDENLVGNARFMSFQYVDLRDLLENGTGIDDLIINVQRLYESPFPSLMFNAPPVGIEETFMMVLGKMDLSSNQGIDPRLFDAAGFGSGNADVTELGLGLPFQVLYREKRRYYADPSQTATEGAGTSPTFAGLAGNPAASPSSLVGNLTMVDRTIGGYPDLIVGPGITIIRMWNVFTANRAAQGLILSASDNQASNYQFLSSQTNLVIPPLQWNIIGRERKLTPTDEAVYYSNILLNT